MSKLSNVIIGAAVTMEEAFSKKVGQRIEDLARKGEAAAAEKAAKKALESLSPEEVQALKALLNK